MRKLSKSLVTIALLAASVWTSAYEAGDMIVRVGAAHVAPTAGDSSVSALSTTVDVDGATQLGFTGTYMVTDNIGIELLASAPFDHEIDLPDGSKVASTKHLPPTLSVQYYPLSNDSQWQPYVGIGVNYTLFFEEETTLGKLKLDDSMGVSFQAGVDYQVSDGWGVAFEAWYIDIDTDATVNDTVKFDVEINPMVYLLGLYYKF